MDLEAAQKVIENPVVQKYIEGIDDDAQVALDKADENLGAMANFPGSAISEYKAHRGALDKNMGEFNGAWNMVVFGKAKDGSAAIDAYRGYVIALVVLEEDNVVIGAYIEARVAEFAAGFIAFIIEVIKAIKKRFGDLLSELQELQKLLQKAKKDVKGAEAQRVINLAITAVSLCIPAVGLGAGIAIAVTTFTVQVVVDASLGPGDPGALGVLNSAAGDVVGLPKAIKPPFAKLGGAVSGLISLKMDTDEIADAKKIVQLIQVKMKSVQSEMKTLEPWVTNSAVKLEGLHTAFEKAVDMARAKAKTFKSAAAERLQLLKELEDLG